MFTISDNRISDATQLAPLQSPVYSHGFVAVTIEGILHVFYISQLNTGYISESSGKSLTNSNSQNEPQIIYSRPSGHVEPRSCTIFIHTCSGHNYLHINAYYLIRYWILFFIITWKMKTSYIALKLWVKHTTECLL